jgi:class 3 adenylate cyclase
VTCRSCGIALRPGARFCDGCGAAVGSAPSGETRRPYTPAHLSENVLASRGAVEGERKQVTVLFADVKGSMEIAERVDAEEWHAILDRFFAILTAGVHRFGGTVNQYTGDGVMALFGAPIAHEDHAERACAAALELAGAIRRYAQELKRERSLGFSARMGLNSGEVVVGRIGDGLRLDYTAQGHTVGLAARMQELCDPGRVYLTQATADLVGDLFDREALGEFRIRGAEAPVRVFALRGAGRLRTRFDVSRQRGLSPFVGRDAELASLEHERLGAEAAGRSIGISADAGTGKSRLFHEVARDCRAGGVAVHAAQCMAHGAAPLLPVVDLFRSFVGIDERDGERDARRKIAGTLLLLDPGLRGALPAVFDLLGVPAEGEPPPDADPERRRETLVEVARAVLRAAGRDQPAVVMIEDLHWADEASLAFVRHLVREIAGLPVLLLLNYRPTFAGASLLGCREIALRPLSPQATTALVGELLGPDPSAAALAEHVVERASGNPFFAEEIVRSLAADGTLTGEKGRYRAAPESPPPRIPATVQALLAARIDRLRDDEKALLQAAAVIGKRFSQRLLETVTSLSADEVGRSLSSLEAAELVFAESRFPEPQFAFEHPLTQEVAYGSLLREKRRGLHAEIAAALARGQGERLDEQTARIAHHWEEAGAAVEAARWNRRAAQWLAGTHSSEALDRLRRSLERLAGHEDAPGAALADLDLREAILRLAPFIDPVSGLSREEAAALVAEGREIAVRAEAREPLASLLSTYGYFLALRGDRQSAERVAVEVSELSRDLADRALSWQLRIDAAQNSFWAGRLHEASRIVEEAAEAFAKGEPLWFGFSVGLSGMGFILALRGLCRSFMGRRAEGRADLEKALAAARAQGTPEALGVAQGFRSLGAVAAGELSIGAAAARAALEVASRLQRTFLAPLALVNTAMVELGRGNPAEAVRILEEIRENFLDAERDVLFEAFALAPLAQAYLETGDPERAAATTERALETASRASAQIPLIFAHLTAARVALAAGGRAAGRTAEEHVAAAAERIEESGASSFLPRLHLVRADLAAARGDPIAAERERDEALRLARRMGVTSPPAG